MTLVDAVIATQQRAGYRVLRSLARDDRAEVLLGFLPGAAPPATDGAASVAVALKAYPSTPEAWRHAITELEALERARGPHVVELLDVDADEMTITLVFERLPRGDLAGLLRIRERIDGGEAVTLLAPIAATVSRMHTAGVAHGALGVRTVLFRADGAPTIIGFGRAECFESSAPEVVLEKVDAVVADRAALRALIAVVLERVAGSRARAARELLSEVMTCADELLLPLITSRIFGLAAAVPVRFTAGEEPEQAAAVDRAVSIGDPVSEGAETTRMASTLGGLLARLVPEPWGRRVVDAVDASPVTIALRPVVATAIGRWRGWSSARRRLALACAVVVVTVIAVAAVFPTSDGPATARSVSGATPSTDATRNVDSPADLSSGTKDQDVRGDDPVAAAVALVQARERCLTSLSVLCLDGVDQVDSGALRDDRAVIRSVQRGGELADPLAPDLTRLAPVLVERLGDSALVRLGDVTSAEPPSTPGPHAEPASILLVKGGAGWRIRDLIAAPGGASQQPGAGSD